MIGRGPVCIGHKHRGEAAVGYFAGLDVSLEETAICIVDDEGKVASSARRPLGNRRFSQQGQPPVRADQLWPRELPAGPFFAGMAVVIAG
jgi:hypothetical protein